MGRWSRFRDRVTSTVREAARDVRREAVNAAVAPIKFTADVTAQGLNALGPVAGALQANPALAGALGGVATSAFGIPFGQLLGSAYTAPGGPVAQVEDRAAPPPPPPRPPWLIPAVITGAAALAIGAVLTVRRR